MLYLKIIASKKINKCFSPKFSHPCSEAMHNCLMHPSMCAAKTVLAIKVHKHFGKVCDRMRKMKPLIHDCYAQLAGLEFMRFKIHSQPACSSLTHTHKLNTLKTNSSEIQENKTQLKAGTCCWSIQETRLRVQKPTVMVLFLKD